MRKDRETTFTEMGMQAGPIDDDSSDQGELQRHLQRVLYRFDCPTPHVLGEYQLDVIGAQQRTVVAAHLTGCEDCRSDLQVMRAFINAPLSMPDSWLGRARRMIATLVTPAPGLAYSGLRGAAHPSVKVYEVEDVTVTLGPGYEANGLIGLVMVTSTPPERLIGHQARLVSVANGPAIATATLDDIGNFEFSDVPPGAYTLELELPDTVVVVESVTVS
jgi:hypothetical protein